MNELTLSKTDKEVLFRGIELHRNQSLENFSEQEKNIHNEAVNLIDFIKESTNLNDLPTLQKLRGIIRMSMQSSNLQAENLIQSEDYDTAKAVGGRLTYLGTLSMKLRIKEVQLQKAQSLKKLPEVDN